MLKVMIVDDEKLAREGLKDLVDWNSLNMEIVSTATNGREALDYLLKNQVDILLTDIKMPQMDGLELLHALAHHEVMPTSIVFSGFNEFQYAQKAIQYGVLSYLLKPIRMDELMEALCKAAERHGKVQHEPATKEEMERFRKSTQQEADRISQEIGKAICSCEEALVRQNCDALFSLLVEGGYSMEVCRRYAFLCAYELSRSVGQFMGEALLLDNTDRMGLMAVAKNVQELQRALEHCVDDLCEQVHTIRQNGRRRIISDALFIIQQQYGDSSMSMMWLSRKLNLTPNYLSSLFSKEMGKTFSEYLEDYRIEQAQRLLQDSQIKVYEVAAAVGYTDPKYFGKVFKQHVGKTPQEYRSGITKDRRQFPLRIRKS